MKKRFLSWLLVLAMVLSMVPTMAFAAEPAGPTQNASIFWTKPSLGFQAIGESDSLSTLFEENAADLSTATTLTIGSGVFTEEDWASIKALTNLEELIFSDAVIVEEEAQMVSGGSTQNSVFPSTLTLFYMPQATEVGHNAFYQCSNLKTVHLPNVTTMGTYAFYDCEALESITLPKLTAIPGNAFEGCVSLVGVSIPNAESIAPLAFNECSALVFADFPKVTTINNGTFDHCDKLQVTHFPSLVTLEEDLPTEHIDLKVLVTNSDDFQSANPAGTVVNLTDSAYTDQVVAIVDGEVKHGESWEAIWDNLADPSSVESIFIVKGNFAASDWNAMNANNTYESDNYPLRADHFAISEGVTFTDEAKALYAGQSYCGYNPVSNLAVSLVTFSVPQLTELKGYALASSWESTTLKHVYLPNVETVGQHAFASNTALTSIYLPSAKTIGTGAFYYDNSERCDALTIIDLPKATSVTGLSNLPALKVASLPKVTTIGEGMFQNDSALKMVNLAGATDMTASNIFSQCSYLKTVILGATVPITTSGTNLGNSTNRLTFPVGTDYATAAVAYRADSTAYNADTDVWSGLQILTPAPAEATLTIGDATPKRYPTLEEALTAANANTSRDYLTITLVTDVTVEATLEVTNSMTLNLAGCDITADTTDNSFSVITLGDGDEKPVLTLTDTTEGLSYGYWAEDDYIIVTDEGEIPTGTAYETFKGGIIAGGKGTSVDDNNCGGGVYVKAGARLTMTGGNIAGNTADQGGGVYIAFAGIVSMSDGKISGNTASQGGGVYVLGYYGTANNATISHNTATGIDGYGGGVYVDRNAYDMAANFRPCEIEGGSIAHNTADEFGGGIYAASTTLVKKATVTGNTATSGGGIYAAANAVVDNSDITDNTATSDGGGIYAVGSVEIYNGEISGNTAVSGNGDGVYQSDRSVIVGEDTVITKNKANATSAEGSGDGIYLATGKYMGLASDHRLTENASVHYTAQTNPTQSAPVIVVWGSQLLTETNAAYFHEAKDHTGDVVFFDDVDHLQLVVWSYTNKTVEDVSQMWASSDSDDDTCAGNGGKVSIDLEDGTYTLVGTKKTVEYTGEAVIPVVTATNWIAEPNTVVYAQSGESGWVNLATDELPTDVGSYRATITHGLSNNINEYYTIIGRTLTTDDFTFEAADGLTYGKDATATVTSDATDGTITLTYYDEDGNPVIGVPTNVGTYTVKITVTEDSGGNIAAITTPLGDANWTFDITAKEVDVDWSVETQYTYTSADQSDELSATYKNVAGNNVYLDITVTQDDVAATFQNVGDYDLKADFATDDADSGNYALVENTTKTTKIVKEDSQGSVGSNTDYTLDNDTITYGDVVKIQYTPQRSTNTPMRAMRAAPISLPALKTAKLYYGETLLATADNVVENIPAVLTFEVNSANFPSTDFDGSPKEFTIKWGGDDNLNGHTETISLTLAKKELTAVVVTDDDSATKVYDGDNAFEDVVLTVTVGEVFDEAIEATVDGTRASANVSALATDKAFTATHDTVTLTGTNNQYYTLPVDNITGTVDITAKEVDVDWSVETQYTYTSADQSDELSATYENVAGNNVDLEITVTQEDVAATFQNVGDYDLKADFATDDADSGNYALAQNTTETTKIVKEDSQGTVTEDDADDYVSDGDTITYGETVTIQFTPQRSTNTPMRAMRAAPIALPALKTAELYYGETLLATADNAVENIPTVLTFEVSSANFPSTDFDGSPKEFTIKWGGDDNLNGHTETISLTLAKKELTAVVVTDDDSATKVYDGDNAFEDVVLTVTVGEMFDEAIEATVDGTRASANVSALDADKAFTATDDTVTLTGTNNQYYTLPVDNITGTVEVTAKTILAAWTNTTQEYIGDSYLNPTVTLVGLVEGDENTTVSFTYVDGEVTDAPTVTNAGAYLVTANPGVNYTLSNPTTTFTITKAALAFTFDENGVVTAHFNGGTTTEGFQVTYIDKDGVEMAQPGTSGSYTVYVTLTAPDAIENFHVAGTAASEGPIGIYTVGAVESTVYFGEDDETGITAVVGATITVPNGDDDGDNKFLGWTDKGGILYKPGDLLTVPKGEMVLTPTYETVYTIGGIVEQYTDNTETTTETREGAVVALKQGNTLLEEVATQASGSFAFTSKAPAGTYNLVVTYNGITVTKIVTIQGASATVTVTLPAGKTNSIVEVVKGTPDIVVGGLDELFKSSLYEQVDKDAVTAGGSVEFKMTLQEVTSTTSIPEIEALASNVGMYVDISISKTVDNGAPSLIPQLEAPVQMIIPIPAALQGMRDYCIYRQHGTDITQLTEEAVDGEYIQVFDTEIHVYAKFFSIYALGYTLPNTGSAMATYQSTVASTEHGTVKLSGTRNKANTTVTITPTPDAGYEVGTVTVTYASGRTVTVTAKDNGTYTYKQPGAAVTVTVTFVNTTSSLKFIDVDADDWFYNAVYWAVEKGITKGKTATLFAPYDVNTRAEAVTFLWRANGSTEMDSDTIFTDVEADSWYEKAVLWATENGTTKGTLDGTTFSPDWTCNRAMIITMIWRLAGSPTVDVENPFQDVSADAWYYDAVMWAVSQNITTGTSETTFSPDQDCSRAEIVTLLYRNAAE